MQMQVQMRGHHLMRDGGGTGGTYVALRCESALDAAAEREAAAGAEEAADAGAGAGARVRRAARVGGQRRRGERDGRRAGRRGQRDFGLEVRALALVLHQLPLQLLHQLPLSLLAVLVRLAYE